MKKRQVVKIISFLLALAVILLGIMFNCFRDILFYKNQVKYTYSAALDELDSSVENIHLNLEKAAYITTAKQINNVAVTIYTEAKIAKSALSQILGFGINHEKLNKFLSQVGNFSVSLAQKLTDGKSISVGERENLIKLAQISDKLSKNIAEISDEYNNSGFWDNEITNDLNNTLEESELVAVFSEIDENMTDYPTLIYDGPYSDYVLPGEPEMLKNKETVQIEIAKQTAAQLLSVNVNDLNLDGEEAGKIGIYRFVYSGGVIGISKVGGYPVYFRKYTADKKQLYTYEQAVSLATKYLSKNSSEKFIATYYYADNGVCTVNFCYLNGTVICYTDLVKIGVDLSNGEIVFYEGRGYLTNHTVRTLPLPKFSVEEAQKVVSPQLVINRSGICVIPTASGEEKQCYEFLCTGEENKEILVYINTQTLAEEQIFIVLHTKGGTLVK